MDLCWVVCLTVWIVTLPDVEQDESSLSHLRRPYKINCRVTFVSTSVDLLNLKKCTTWTHVFEGIKLTSLTESQASCLAQLTG